MTGKQLRRLRKWSQLIFFLLFLGLIVAASSLTLPKEWTNILFRFDPLIAITSMVAGKIILSGLLLSLLVVGLTLVFGRVWCGWICPLGTVLDWITPDKRKQSRIDSLESWRTGKYFLLFAMLAASLFGNQSLSFLDPITIVSRSFTSVIWPGLRHAVFSSEKVLFQFEIFGPALDVVHTYLVYPLFRDIPSYFSQAFPILLFFVGIIALNWVAERFWCRYICPLGGLLGVFSKFALFRREVGENCSNCALCSKRCPTGTIDPKKRFTSDPSECTVCFDCVADCAKGETNFRFQGKKWRVAAFQSYDPNRRRLIKALGAGAALAAVSGVEPIQKVEPANLVRPPGARLTDFESLCIRCGACVRVCPTQGLQPTLFEAGWQNLLTPVLQPRLGYCNFNCNACGIVCPTGAIPLLPMDQKQKTGIGLARVDRSRCLPWVYNTPCIVCEEMCPLPDKAIKLEETSALNAQGEEVFLQRPYVIKELCIGCGICEYKCPMGGEAAIRVYTYTEAGTKYG